MAKIGDTFRLANSRTNSHLFVIISDPTQDPDHIVTVNFTSSNQNTDQSCVMEVGEHPFLKWQSCVYYGGQDRLITLAEYKRCLRSGDLLPHKPVSKDLLTRILNGAATSPFLPLGSRQILVEQGLIDNE